MSDLPDNATQAEIDDIYNAMTREVEKQGMETITCEQCGRIFTQGTDSGRPYGECPACQHINHACEACGRVLTDAEWYACIEEGAACPNCGAIIEP